MLLNKNDVLCSIAYRYDLMILSIYVIFDPLHPVE